MSEELEKGIPDAIVVGHVEYTEEEKEEKRKRFEIILKKNGFIKENQHIKEYKHPE